MVSLEVAAWMAPRPWVIPFEFNAGGYHVLIKVRGSTGRRASGIKVKPNVEAGPRLFR